MDKTNFLKRCEEFQNWMWKEFFDLSILHATAYGMRRCLPLLEVCKCCLAACDAERSSCPSSHLHPSQVDVEGKLPVRISLIKALVALIEASVPCEALHTSWTDDHRKSWGVKLQNCSSAEALLQVITQFEGAIKRDFMSADFEAVIEVLCHYDLLRGELTHTRSIPRLPWIPCTASAVALRLMELDASIYYNYTTDRKAESRDDKTSEAPPAKFSLRYGRTKEDTYGSVKEENQDHLPDVDVVALDMGKWSAGKEVLNRVKGY